MGDLLKQLQEVKGKRRADRSKVAITEAKLPKKLLDQLRMEFASRDAQTLLEDPDGDVIFDIYMFGVQGWEKIKDSEVEAELKAEFEADLEGGDALRDGTLITKDTKLADYAKSFIGRYSE